LLRVEHPTSEKLFIVSTILVTITKYTTQDLLKLLQIKLSTCGKLFMVPTIWLL
jgi:hypothetical protein